METSKAYDTLELTSSATLDEVKKQFKKLAAKYHPDVNKEPDAADKFKAIKEAYEVITNPPPPPPAHPFGGVDSFFQDAIFSHFVRAVTHRPPLKITTNLTFAESVLGCKKAIRVQKMVMCESCLGHGAKATGAVCSTCNGRKQKNHLKGNVILVEPCSNCKASGKAWLECTDCKGAGAISAERSLDIKLQGGLQNGQKIQLRGGGHYNPQTNSFEHDGFVGDAIVTVTVAQEDNMKLSGMDVISKLDVTLLEALEGVKKSVKTVNGDAYLKVPAGSRNKDELSLAGCGVPSQGVHKFILDVHYPDPIADLVDCIKQKFSK